MDFLENSKAIGNEINNEGGGGGGGLYYFGDTSSDVMLNI